MTATVGAAVTWAAVAALVAAGGLSIGGRPRIALLANRAGSALAAAAVVTLAWALASGDFTMAYVAAVTDRATTWPYRLAGLWGGMGGSLLLWSALVAAWGWRRHLGAVERAAGAWLAAGFLVVGVVWATPWHQLAAPAIDGAGATPILRHPAMLYHPPLLYLGLTSLAMPWAALLGAGAAVQAGDAGAGQAKAPWTERLRRLVLLSIGLLAVGMVAGAHWAYVELGWGGYWAWDPVENTALLPWLAAVGAVHALARNGRGGGRAWAGPGLAGAALALAVLGTMLTRSGSAPSVHAFGEDAAVGRALLAMTAIVVVVSAVAAWRLRSSPAQLTVATAAGTGDADRSGRSADVALAAQPWLAAFAVVVVLVGTVRPLVGDDEVAIGGRFYSSLLGPVAALALVLALRYRPAVVAHLGAAVLAVGILGSTRTTTGTATLAPGEVLEVGGWEVESLGASAVDERTVVAPVVVRRDSHVVARLEPSLVAYPDRGVLLAETSLRSSPLADVQVALRNADDAGRALLEVQVRPLVWCVWWGGLLVGAAALLAAIRGRVTLVSGRGGRRSSSARSAAPPGPAAVAQVEAPASVVRRRRLPGPAGPG